MNFTYDLGHADPDKVLVSKVRFELGDTEVDEGVKPNGDNFTDEEVTYWLNSEDGHVMRAVAAGLETLTRLWSLVPDTKLGPHGESASQIASAYERQAAMLRKSFGYANTTRAMPFAIGTIPTNPYDTSGEYSA